jgi:hypothetical protein
MYMRRAQQIHFSCVGTSTGDDWKLLRSEASIALVAGLQWYGYLAYPLSAQ